MANIRISDLPPGPPAIASDVVAIDGSTTRKTTLLALVNAGRPFASQAEAEAGVSAVKGMSPLTTKQAIESAAPNYATASQGVLASSAIQPGDTRLVPAGGGQGQFLAKSSTTDFDFEWSSAGAGDMLANVYDPTAINASPFARDNHTGSQAISTVTGLQTALDAKLAAVPNNYVSDAMLLTGSKIKNRLNEAYVSDYLVGGVPDLATALARNNRIVIDVDVPFAANYAVGANRRLIFRGGRFTGAAGVVISLNNTAEIEAGWTQILSGGITFSNIKVARCEWWGAINSTTVIATSYMQSALNALRSYGLLELNQGFYAHDGSVLFVTNGQVIQGQSRYASTVRIISASGACNLLHFDTQFGGSCMKLRVEKVDNTPTSGILFDYATSAARRGRLSELFVSNYWNFLEAKGSGQVDIINSMTIEDCIVSGCYNRGVLLQWSGGINILGLNMNATPGRAPQGLFCMSEQNQAVNVMESNFSNSSGACLRIFNSAANGPLNGFDSRFCSFTHCFFDDGGPAAQIQDCAHINFVQCGFTSSGRLSIRPDLGVVNGGCLLARTQNIIFSACQFLNNGTYGIRITAGCRFTQIENCLIGGNSVESSGTYDAIVIAAGVSDFTITGNAIGSGFFRTRNTAYGINIATGASNHYIIMGNTFAGCVSGNIADGGTGTDKFVSANLTTTAANEGTIP